MVLHDMIGNVWEWTTKGLVSAMLLDNAAPVAVLLYAGLSLKLPGIGLWPAVLLHLALAVWCIGCIGPVLQDWSRG